MGDPKTITAAEHEAAVDAEEASPAFNEPHYVLDSVRLALRKGDAIFGTHGELFPDADGQPAKEGSIAPQSLWEVRAHMHGLDGAKMYCPKTAFFIKGDTEAEVHDAIAAHLHVSVSHQQRERDLAAEPHPFGEMGVARVARRA